MPRDSIDFDSLKRQLLTDARSLVTSWCPGGKVIQHEYVPLNPTRADKKPGSFRINLQTGHWADFATGDKGGDLIGLYAYVKGLTQVEAARQLSAGGTSPTVQRIPAPPRQPELIQIIPAPDNQPPPDHFKHGPASNTWTYRTTTAELIGYVCRYNLEDGSKEYSIWAYFQNTKTGELSWKWRSFDKPRPLYGLETLDTRPVIITEGEKAADAGRTLFPTHSVLAWPGGDNAVEHADFTPLHGRQVILWPDNDAPGFKAMRAVAAKLSPHVAVQTVSIPDHWPPKHDLADVGWTVDEAARFLAEAFGTNEPSEPEIPMPDYETDHQPTVISNNQYFRPLGYNKRTYYYYVAGTQDINEMTPVEHSKGNLLEMAPGLFWEREFGGSSKRTGVNWEMAAEKMLEACQKAGRFDHSQVRGRGAWFDEGKCVLNLGNRVACEGEEHEPFRAPFKHVYEAGYALHADLSNPLTTTEANRFYELVSMLSWERPISARLLAGWCVCAHIGGVLNWRPHVWIVGSKGTGKSWCMKSIVKRVLGENCLFALGDTTEAGIRQTLGKDSIPIMFDEAEGNDQKATARLQNILALVRQSSSETGGKIIKGAANGKAVQYSIRSCFAFSSINSSLMQESDRSRVSVLEMSQAHNRYTFPEIVEAQLALFQGRYVERFYARSIALAAVIRVNAHTFADAVAAELGEQRAGDQLGALLAGAYSLFSNEVISIEKARKWVQEQNWEADREEVQSMSDEQSLMHFLLSQRVKFRAHSTGVFEDVPVGVLVDAVNATEDNLMYPRDAAQQSLKWAGFKVEDGCLYVSNTSSDIKRMLEKQPWALNYSRVLKRLPGATTTNGISFGHKGSTARATRIPLG